MEKGEKKTFEQTFFPLKFMILDSVLPFCLFWVDVVVMFALGIDFDENLRRI
jgi:hypothetical protein